LRYIILRLNKNMTFDIITNKEADLFVYMGNTGFFGLSVGDYNYFDTVPAGVVLKASGQVQTGGDYFVLPLSENQYVKDRINNDEDAINLYKGKEQNAYIKASDADVVPSKKDGGKGRSAKKGKAAKLKLAVVLRDLCKETEQEIKEHKKKRSRRGRK
jgi:hypothetical protein